MPFVSLTTTPPGQPQVTFVGSGVGGTLGIGVFVGEGVGTAVGEGVGPGLGAAVGGTQRLSPLPTLLFGR